MKWQCRSLEYALARVGHLPFITEPFSLFILIFQKISLLWTNSSPNLPRKPFPHTPLLHRENSSQTPLSFECWNPKPVFVLRKTLSHFNLQTVPPIPNPSEPTVPKTSPENPSQTHLSFHYWIPQPVLVLRKTINQFYLAF